MGQETRHHYRGRNNININPCSPYGIARSTTFPLVCGTSAKYRSMRSKLGLAHMPSLLVLVILRTPRAQQDMARRRLRNDWTARACGNSGATKSCSVVRLVKGTSSTYSLIMSPCIDVQGMHGSSRGLQSRVAVVISLAHSLRQH